MKVACCPSERTEAGHVVVQQGRESREHTPGP
jgi:hypothetical protein